MAEEGTFTTNAEVLRKAGLGVSTTSSAEAYTNQFIQEVEGFICSIVRSDWVTDYAGLDDWTKELIREATSNMAAIYVIQYDTSGIARQREAENRINILWKRFLQSVKLIVGRRWQ